MRKRIAACVSASRLEQDVGTREVTTLATCLPSTELPVASVAAPVAALVALHSLLACRAESCAATLLLQATQVRRHRGVYLRKGGGRGRKLMGRAPRCVGVGVVYELCVGVVYERIAGTLTVLLRLLPLLLQLLQLRNHDHGAGILERN
jgi:hypothetical protein